MWQRVQTIFLLIAVIINFTVLFLDIAIIQTDGQALTFKINEMADESGMVFFSTWTLYVAFFASIMMSLQVIFMYKKRQFQIKMSQLNLLIQVAAVALIFFMVDEAVKSLGQRESMLVVYSVGTYISILPMLFIYLAIKRIKKDEALVRAADRIR